MQSGNGFVSLVWDYSIRDCLKELFFQLNEALILAKLFMDKVNKSVVISKRLVLINSLSGVVCRILRVTIIAWLYQHLLKRVSTDEFSVYALIMALMVFAPLFSTLFTSGVSRYIIDACARKDDKEVKRIVSSIVPILFLWSLSFWIFGGLFVWQVDRILSIPPAYVFDAKLMLALLFFEFGVQIFLVPFLSGFHVRQKFVLLNNIKIVGELFRIGLLMWLMYGVGTQVLWVVLSTVTTNLLVIFTCVWISVKLLPTLKFERKLFELKTASKLFSFGFWSTLNQLAYMLYISGDILILNKLSTPLDVTNFKLGTEFYVQIVALAQVAVTAFIPALTAMNATQDIDRLGRWYIKGSQYCLWASMIIACPLIVYGDIVIKFYAGSTYNSATFIMIWFLFLLPFTQSIRLISPLAVAKAKLQMLSIANISVQLVKLGVTLVFVYYLGLGGKGCAISSFLVVAISCIAVYWPLSTRLTSTNLKRYYFEVIWLGLLPTVGTLVVAYLLRSYQTPNNWFDLIVHFGLCGVSYAIILFLFCLKQNQRNELLKALNPSRLIKIN